MQKIRLPLLIIATVILAGCGMTLRSGWADFNAYFNTYYNASTIYERAYEQVERQHRREQINPERPIRIHRTPPRVAQQDFEDVIMTSADILREHNESRWVDNAIELIGKSYFYMQQYFSADQKFIELYSNALTSERRQNSILWRGRVFLEMQEYNAGINYLDAQLYSAETDWDPQIEAEVKMVLAQLYVAVERWEDAENVLSEALEVINERKLRFRGSFLYGQILEFSGKYNEAFDAYEVSTHRSNIEFYIVYNAKKKMGKMARRIGDYQWAYDHFRSMSRDDKFFEFLGDIEYEMARTLQLSGNHTDAEALYKRLLRRSFSQPGRESRSGIYYGLAEISRDTYNDYNLAAAYYDSSAQQATDLQRMPKGFDARVMARSFGDYARLTTESSRLDSLLWLGQLSEAEFDSVVNVVRERKIREMERLAREDRQATLVTIDSDDVMQADEISENGFLNHKNPQITRQMNQAFMAYWGQRPLVDDWRRQEAVRVAIEEKDDDLDDEEREALIDQTAGAQTPEQQVLVDVSEVPFTEEEQQRTRQRIAATEYEIGNVFFLTLNMPDSAVAHYSKVIDRFPDSDVAPQALYTLSELYSVSGDSTQATYYASRLVDTFPRTTYAQRINERFGLTQILEQIELTREDTIRVAYQNVMQAYRNSPDLQTAESLREFRYKYPDAEQAPIVLYRAALEYIRAGRDSEEYAELATERENVRRNWRQKENELASLRDSANVMLSDTTLSESEIENWQAVADSTLGQPDLSEYFPYHGAVWDSSRVILADLSENYTNFPRNRQVQALYEEIRLPVEETEEDLTERDSELDQLDSEPVRTTDIDEFLAASGFQEIVDDLRISGLLVITVTVEPNGSVSEINLGQEYDGLGISEPLAEAIRNYMEFEPAVLDGKPVRATFEMELEVHYR